MGKNVILAVTNARVDSKKSQRIGSANRARHEFGVMLILKTNNNRHFRAFMEPAIHLNLKEILEIAFREDIGFGDVTSSAVLIGRKVKGTFTARAEGTLAGTGAIETGYRMLDNTVSVQNFKKDGHRVHPEDKIAEVEGPAGTLLSGERVILNILQHMSGIATSTAEAVAKLKGSSVRVCDTRKTLPGLRALQKYAVRCGGGYNHRMRLDDGIMIKDNHIRAAGGILQAVELARKKAGLMVKVEVECETPEQVLEAVSAGVDIIMLDNRSPEEVKELCKLIPGNIIIELSGGISPASIGSYRDCGADYISIGAITHSVTALDISFNLLADDIGQ